MSYATTKELETRLAADGAAAIPAEGILADALASASAAVDAHCRWDFAEHKADSVTVRVIRSGCDTLLLPVRALKAVSAVTEDGVAWSQEAVDALQVLPIGAVVRPDGETWCEGSVVVFTCDHGDAAPPVRVKEATLRLASRTLRHGKIRDRIAEGVKSESIEGYSITLDDITMDRDVAVLLEDYRRKWGAR